MPAKKTAAAHITTEDISALAEELEVVWRGRISIAVLPMRAKSGRPYWWVEAQLIRRTSDGKADYPHASATLRWPQWSYKTFYGCMYASLWDLNAELERRSIADGREVQHTIVLAALPDKPQ